MAESLESHFPLQKSKTGILDLIQENRLLMFPGLVETLTRRPTEEISSESETDEAAPPELCSTAPLQTRGKKSVCCFFVMRYLVRFDDTNTQTVLFTTNLVGTFCRDGLNVDVFLLR